MIIAISGLTGAGKTTLAKRLAKELGYNLVNYTFKDLAKELGIDFMELHKKAEQDNSIDLMLDEKIKEMAKGNSVVASWIACWKLDADLKIGLFAPLDVRAKRIAKRDNMDIKEAIEHVAKRDEINRERYLKLYGIDIYDYSIYDILINTSTYNEDEVVEKIKCIIGDKI